MKKKHTFEPERRIPRAFTPRKFIIIILIIFLVGTERLAYLSTLLKTSFNMPGYELGNLIKANTSPQDTVLVDSRQFKGFFEVFVGYYSDRKVDYGDISLKEFEKAQPNYKKYKYIILIDERTEDPTLESYLNDIFPSKRFGPYQFFALDNKI